MEQRQALAVADEVGVLALALGVAREERRQDRLERGIGMGALGLDVVGGQRVLERALADLLASKVSGKGTSGVTPRCWVLPPEMR